MYLHALCVADVHFVGYTDFSLILGPHDVQQEELEQREAQVSSLTNQVDSLTSTASTLQEELAASNAEAERLHTELQSFKQISTEPDKNHTLALEHRLREVLEEVERLKLQVQHWKSNAQSEQALRDQAEEGLVTLRESKVTAETYASTLHDQLSAEKQTTRELQDVLAELEASKAEEVAGASIEAQQELERLSSQLEVQTRMAQAAEVRVRLGSCPFLFGWDCVR